MIPTSEPILRCRPLAGGDGLVHSWSHAYLKKRLPVAAGGACSAMRNGPHNRAERSHAGRFYEGHGHRQRTIGHPSPSTTRAATYPGSVVSSCKERGYAKASRHIEPETGLVYKAEGGRQHTKDGYAAKDKDRPERTFAGTVQSYCHGATIINLSLETRKRTGLLTRLGERPRHGTLLAATATTGDDCALGRSLLTDRTGGSQCLVAGAEDIRTAGPLWHFSTWKKGRGPAVFCQNLLPDRSENL
jgi:hypothetical protein